MFNSPLRPKLREILGCFSADKETRVRALVWTAAEKRRDEEDTPVGTKEQNSGCGAGGRSGNSLLDPLSAVAVLNDLEISRRQRRTRMLSHVTRAGGEKENLPKNPAKNALALPSLPFLIIISPAETIYHLYQSPTSPAKEKFANSSLRTSRGRMEEKGAEFFHVHRRACRVTKRS